MYYVKRSLQVSAMLMVLSFSLSACQSQAVNKTMATIATNKSLNSAIGTIALTEFEQKIAQRMSLDIRYYCADIDGKPSVKSSLHCRKPVTKLPEELSTLISATTLGGIVLFAENVQDTSQIVQLTHDIQQAAVKSSTGKPLIISMDQEGGRVARFAKMTGFSGNMAIGASYPKHAEYFATQVNTVIAKELKVLGINNNYAPVVDVNTNANNPVINTRSFGESALQVSKLGASAVNAIQAQGVMATLKHFPGHGDTHVDSHLGLPRVDHDRATIDSVDLSPFAWAIKYSNPAMIMTAHIQYPALDSSVFVSKEGEKLIRPATMSRPILTGLLREEMKFKGIIATDALDMAGITHFFTDVEAVVETFIAGADLAVMPFKVRTPDDIANFYRFIREVAKDLNARIEQGDYSLLEFEHSIERLNQFKNQYIKMTNDSLVNKTTLAQTVIATSEHLKTEQGLANAAVTLLKNGRSGSNEVIPLAINKIKKMHLVVASQQELDALLYAINKVIDSDSIELSYFIADNVKFNKTTEQQLINADIVIATIDIKTASLVDLGGMDDLTPSYGSAAQKQQKQTYAKALTQQLISAKAHNTASILIAKGSPFLMDEYSKLADAVLLNFDDRIYENDNKQLTSPGFNSSISAIFGQLIASGTLPVSAP